MLMAAFPMSLQRWNRFDSGCGSSTVEHDYYACGYSWEPYRAERALTFDVGLYIDTLGGRELGSIRQLLCNALQCEKDIRL